MQAGRLLKADALPVGAVRATFRIIFSKSHKEAAAICCQELGYLHQQSYQSTSSSLKDPMPCCELQCGNSLTLGSVSNSAICLLIDFKISLFRISLQAVKDIWRSLFLSRL